MNNRHHPIWTNLFRKTADKDKTIANHWIKTPLFQEIAYKHCLAMVPDMHVRQFEAGEAIFNKGETGLGVALVLSGKIDVLADNNLLAELKPGDFFGEVALVTEEPRTADAVAASNSEVVYILRPHLDEWMEKSPRTGAIFMSNLARILARRLSKANELLSKNHD